MGSCSCTRRHFLLSICFLQMITIIERQVFDFLGYMWAPILVNFFQILFIIFGFYGAYHFRIKYIITYLLWNFIWIGWNAFLICFYLNVGNLDREGDLLNMGTGSVSWFEANGYGCKPTYNITSDDPFRPLRPERVEDCLLDYQFVEVVHSGVQCALALLGILGAILISCIFLDEDDRFDFMNGDAKSPQHTVVHPMYVSYTSIPTTASASATMQSNKQLQQFYHQQQQHQRQHKTSNSNNNNHSNCNSYNNTLNNRQAETETDTDKATINHNAYKQLTRNTSGNNSNIGSNIGSNKRHSESSQQRRKMRTKNHNSNLNSVSPMSISMSMSTTPSLSYASLQNSNPQLAHSMSLSNSNYSICQQHNDNNSHFARIHHKPKPPKSLPDIKYSQLPLERLSRNLEEDEDDQFSLPSENGGVTYVPFQSPSLFEHAQTNSNNNQTSSQSSPNNNQTQPKSLCYSPRMLRVPRPTQIPMPTVPIHSCQLAAELSPPPRPHIFQPRLGQSAYPDLSPEIAEKYAMPTQHVVAAVVVPGSPMVRRSGRRPQPRPSQPSQANFCDIVRTQSDDRLEQELELNQQQSQQAPHVNRRSGKKSRPRSFCNSIVNAQA
ncbi:hypothetical protein ACLKA7_000489 [Drosophila subpalustris]